MTAPQCTIERGYGGGVRMVVKSATKKRLIDLGVAEDQAHALADDRNMDMIKDLSTDEVRTILGLKEGAKDLESVMGVIRELGARRRSRSRRTTERIRVLQSGTDEEASSLARFNVLNHALVPHHEFVESDREAEELARWNLMVTDMEGNSRLAKELLPKILITDPVVQVLKETEELKDPELPAGWLNNRVVKVVRPSPSAGTTVAYRLVVEGN